MSTAQEIESPRAMAVALWRRIEAEQPSHANQLTVLGQMWAAYQHGQSAARAERHRTKLAHLRGITFRRLLVATDELAPHVKTAAGRRLARCHEAVTPSDIIEALGHPGQMALARIRVAPDYDLPPGRFELGAPKMSEVETPAGRAAILVAPGYPRPVDLIAVTINDGRPYRLSLDGALIPAPRSSLARRTTQSWAVHVHGAAWISARARAVRAGFSPDAVPPLLIDPAAMIWTRKGDLGVIKTLNVVDARGDDAADPVHAIWRAIPAATRKTLALNIPAALKQRSGRAQKTCSRAARKHRDSTLKKEVVA